MFSVIENSVNFDALYLAKLIFGKYFCYFNADYKSVAKDALPSIKFSV